MLCFIVLLNDKNERTLANFLHYVLHLSNVFFETMYQKDIKQGQESKKFLVFKIPMDFSHCHKMGFSEVEIKLNLSLSIVCNRCQRGVQLKLSIENFICQGCTSSQRTIFVSIYFESKNSLIFFKGIHQFFINPWQIFLVLLKIILIL